MTLRDAFDLFEERALAVSPVKQYHVDTSRRKRRNIAFDESDTGETESAYISGSHDFRVNTFFVIIDKLSALAHRIDAYAAIVVLVSD